MKENPVILVVEDDAAVRQGVVDALSFAGYEVISAADGREGMEKALRASYQLLLLDLVMPHYSGFEVLEALRKERPGQPVIILSARGEEADRVKGLTMERSRIDGTARVPITAIRASARNRCVFIGRTSPGRAAPGYA